MGLSSSWESVRPPSQQPPNFQPPSNLLTKLNKTVQNLFKTTVTPTTTTPNSSTKRKGQAILDRATPEESAIWKEAFEKWKKEMRNPQLTEEHFSEDLFKSQGLALRQPLRKFAAVHFLGDRPSRQLFKGLGVTVILSPPKEDREVKIVVYSPKKEVLGKGGEATVYKCLALSEKIKGSQAISTPIKAVAYRESGTNIRDEVGNQTIQGMTSHFQELKRDQKSLPLGVALDERDRPIGIRKPLKIISPDKAYDKLMVGSTDQWLEKKPSLTERLLVIKDLMHGYGAITASHADFLDLKPENILIDTRGHAFISDWSGVKIGKSLDRTVSPQETLDVIQAYFSEKAFLHTSYYNLRSDINQLVTLKSKCELGIKKLQAALREGGLGHFETDILKKDWNSFLDCIEKMQMFQLGLCIAELLAPNENAKKALLNALEPPPQKGNQKRCIKEPFTLTAIKDLVISFNYGPDATQKIIAFLKETIGPSSTRHDQRPNYERVWSLFNELYVALERERVGA